MIGDLIIISSRIMIHMCTASVKSTYIQIFPVPTKTWYRLPDASRLQVSFDAMPTHIPMSPNIREGTYAFTYVCRLHRLLLLALRTYFLGHWFCEYDRVISELNSRVSQSE
jgi:hypothetical protein